MIDYIDTGNSSQNNSEFLSQLFFKLYHATPNRDVFLGLNLQWPTFELSPRYSRYFLSFHTEYIHLSWLLNQAQKVYPCPVTLVTDYAIEPGPHWPDNIQCIQWITTHKQIKILQDITGSNNNITVPKYKISSLSYRVSQYKKFITAYLLANFNKNDMILTYHNNLGKIQDHHGHPPGFSHLDKLDIDGLKKTTINFDDNFTGGVSPVKNGDWLNSAYMDALINLTNESFHYSQTEVNDQPYCWPGPYITEKTFKPLLAGKPFLAVAQYQTYDFLRYLGFKTDFGLDLDYDQDPGDLTRIGKIFKVIDAVNETSTQILFDSSIDAVKYNLSWIHSNNFHLHCQDLNSKNFNFLKNTI
jgi:hypothetical protein